MTVKISSTVTSAVVVLVGLSLYWAVGTFTGIEEEFSTADLVAFAGTGAFAVLVQLLIVVVVDRRLKKPAITYAVTGLFIVLNAFSFNLAFAGDFLLLGLPLILPILAAGWFIATVIVRIADESPRLRPYVFAAIAALIASPFVLMAVRSDAHTVSVGDAKFTASPNVRKVDFKTKPNVYFIGFDAAAPAAVVEKYLGLKPAPFPVGMKKHGFRGLSNLFTESMATSTSWKMLLSLDRSYFDTLPKFNGGLMQGLNPSPLIQIFKHNGYEVTTLYKNTYFGVEKGPYVDHYRYNKVFSICDFIGEDEKRVAFYAACYVRATRFFPHGVEVKGKDIDFFVYHLKPLLKRKRPQAVFAHLHPPAHTNQKIFKYVPEQILTFRMQYKAWSHKAAKNLGVIKDMIIESDPDSVIYVFGDHGMHLSSGGTGKSQEFFVQDKFGVLGGTYPPDFCSNEIDQARKQKGFLTTTWVARLIVKCLADGDDPFVNRDYQHTIFVKDRSLRAEDYLYE